VGDGENGRDGVEGEEDVGQFDSDEGKQQHGGLKAGAGTQEKLSSGIGGRVCMDEVALEPTCPTGCGGGSFCRVGEQANGGIEQDKREEKLDPMEAGDECDAAEDEASTHKDGPNDSPEKHVALMIVWDAEAAKK